MKYILTQFLLVSFHYSNFLYYLHLDSSSSSSSDEDEDNATGKKDETETNDERLSDTTTSKLKVLATPAVRRIAIENKVDLSAVPATGKLGRVLKGDVLEYLNLVPAGTNIPHPTLTKITQCEKPIVGDRVEVLKGIRKAMLKSMTESLVRF